ncbi:SusC/RagA family TonB-linked outer membrane protein [Rufibacter quisquiliarum]|uniref:TonB-linked SusC/RagA family outer membrane protein n=1 Tax=Rufibacter quisquiliarum TaxID=1549639 RepID=A0A839GHM9_9BACT|nr:TonB-dependent receptor [Rufibacter quisquiliarum]MBA9077153.1 TonB-linked SusC/RagA family outer membrane protein [Rufibacter quisquiliarum]
MKNNLLSRVSYLLMLLLVLLSVSELFAQGLNIRGRITDEKGEGLPGVTVMVKGTTNGASTGVDGTFSFTVPNREGTLVISFIGYKPREMAIPASGEVNVALQTDAKLLQEVEIGYGTATRQELTGSVGMANMQDIYKAPVKSVDEALAGRVAGVLVSANDGQPGSNQNIVIRGVGSITGSSAPLYVIDGFPMEESYSNSLSPNDIESIDILKDASATAIYGARGANGVILITTKRGKKGAPVVTYNAYYGFSENPKSLKLLNAYEYVKYQSELNAEFAEKAFFVEGRDLESYRNAPTIDLQDQIYQRSPVQNHEISVRGGNDNTIYSISGNIIDQDGIIVNSSFRRYQGRITLDQKLGKKIKVGVDLNYSNEKTNGTIATDANTTRLMYSNLSLLFSVWGHRPVNRPNETAGDQLFDPTLPESDFRVNPVVSAKNDFLQVLVNNFRANAYVEYTIIPSLTLRIAGGATNIMMERQGFFNSSTARGNFRRDEKLNGYIYHRPVTNWNNTNTLTYRKTFKTDHAVTAVVGTVIQKQEDGNYGFQAIQALNEQTGVDGLDEAEANFGTSGSSRWSMASFLGRVNYSYKNRYIVTGTLRYDGSSKFAPGNRWGVFPSVGLAWRVIEENFMKNISLLSDAKVRASYGATGNNRVSDFAYMSTLVVPRTSGYSFNNSSPTRGAILESYGNPNLKWETTVQSNIGVDLAFFNHRVDMVVDFYRKTTKDVLLNANLPYTTGLVNTSEQATAFKNIGKVQNDGLEFTINTINLRKNTFEWSTNFNISFNKNKVLGLNEGQTSLLQTVRFDQDFANTPAYIATLGQPIGQMYGLIWDGVYQLEDFDVSTNGAYVLKSTVPNNSQPRQNIQPGDIKYKDINGDLVVNELDFAVIGRGIPLHTGGFSNNITYKGFDLNVFFQWSYGNDIINANRLFFEGNAKRMVGLNQYAEVAERWTPENPSNTYFRTGGKRDLYYSSREVEDGSFLRLKTVSLGYNFSEALLHRIKLKTLRVYASAQNIYTWTNYSGSNPDVSTRHSALTPGFDFSAYPLARTVTFGLTTSF